VIFALIHVYCDVFSIRIDKYNSKEIKESIFLAEAREMQNQLLNTAEDIQSAPHLPLPPVPSLPTLVRMLHTKELN
jgi:hypothetical protein